MVYKNIIMNFWNPSAAVKQEVLLAFKLALENSLNAQNILQAFQDR